MPVDQASVFQARPAAYLGRGVRRRIRAVAERVAQDPLAAPGAFAPPFHDQTIERLAIDATAHTNRAAVNARDACIGM